MMLKYGGVIMLMLAGWAAIDPPRMSWIYIGVVAAFEVWLLSRMRAAGRNAVVPGEPPYHFSAEEAALVGRYRFYFTFPDTAAGAGSVLAAIGLSSMLLAVWLTFRNALIPAAIVGLNLFAVGWFTRQAAPVYAMRLKASRGNREALRLLELVQPAWDKIRAGNKV